MCVADWYVSVRNIDSYKVTFRHLTNDNKLLINVTNVIRQRYSSQCWSQKSSSNTELNVAASKCYLMLPLGIPFLFPLAVRSGIQVHKQMYGKKKGAALAVFAEQITEGKKLW